MATELDYMEPLLKYQKKKCFEDKEENSNETEYSYLRNLPDMSEGLIGLCIGDIMGILLSLNSNNTLSLQQQQILKVFIETLLKTSKSSLSIFKLSIFYLYKLNKKLREPKLLEIFRTKLISNNLTTMETIEQAKLLFVVILMLAFKYTEDHCYYISAWSKATGIKSEIIHKVEVEILNILDHNLFVSKERFEYFSSRIIQKINKLKFDLLQSIKISYASSNYSSSEEENSNKCENSLYCRKCCCKRKQESSLINTTTNLYKKRRISLDTNNTIPKEREQQADNASTFYTLPTTLYDYYNNRNGHGLGKQPLTPPTPNPFLNTSNNNNNNNININNNKINGNNNSSSNNLLQVDSLIIPSTPPTSQTSIYEDMERDEEIKKDKIEEENDNEKYYEENEEVEVEEDELDEEDENETDFEGEGGDEDEEEDQEDNIKEQLPKNQNAFKSSTMAFILNPDENKIQLDYGQKEQHKLEAKTIPYHYHIPSPSHHKTNFAYDNLKKINLLEKNEKTRTRTTASIVLPNTSPVGEVASIFPSLSMLSQSQNIKNDSIPIEDTTNKNLSIGLKSLFNNESSMNSIIISNSEDDEKSNQCPLKSNYINIHNDKNDTNTNTNNNNNINITNACPYLNNLCTLPNDDIAKQNILLSIYNCYAMRNIRHYQI